jgi:superfamily II DNA/RNA helicase
MTGIALSFCDTKERALLKSIQKLIGKKLNILEHELAISESVQKPERRSRRR